MPVTQPNGAVNAITNLSKRSIRALRFCKMAGTLDLCIGHRNVQMRRVTRRCPSYQGVGMASGYCWYTELSKALGRVGRHVLRRDEANRGAELLRNQLG